MPAEWFEIAQDRIDAFANITLDPAVDPHRSGAGEGGVTLWNHNRRTAFLTLSLAQPSVVTQASAESDAGFTRGQINYVASIVCDFPSAVTCGFGGLRRPFYPAIAEGSRRRQSKLVLGDYCGSRRPRKSRPGGGGVGLAAVPVTK